MSNIALYSPFNRSYQFMHIQNSAYHRKNKKNVKPIVKTNLKHDKNATSPQKSKRASSAKLQRYSSSRGHVLSEANRVSFRDHSPTFNEPHRVVHRNEITERAKSARISSENMKIVQRLIEAECIITDKTKASGFYNQQKKYKSLRRRYQETGQRLMIPLGNLKLLNPTLASFKSAHPNLSRRQIYDSQASQSEWAT